MRSVKTVPCRTQEWDFCYNPYSVLTLQLQLRARQQYILQLQLRARQQYICFADTIILGTDHHLLLGMHGC